jgi:YHS domain-containing protein
MVKDPVCGMYMDPRLAVTHRKNGGVFYFCSEECKRKFLEIPPGKNPGEPSRDS